MTLAYYLPLSNGDWLLYLGILIIPGNDRIIDRCDKCALSALTINQTRTEIRSSVGCIPIARCRGYVRSLLHWKHVCPIGVTKMQGKIDHQHMTRGSSSKDVGMWRFAAVAGLDHQEVINDLNGNILTHTVVYMSRSI